MIQLDAPSIATTTVVRNGVSVATVTDVLSVSYA
jgi:hypothetical protein